MGRIRHIKPEFFENEHLASLSFEARLAFIGLWTLADKEGRLRDRPGVIKARLFPFNEVPMDDILATLAKPQGNGDAFIHRYQVNGERYICIHKFLKHQRLSTWERDKTESEIPPPPKDYGSTSVELQKNFSRTTLALLPREGELSGEGELKGEGEWELSGESACAEAPRGDAFSLQPEIPGTDIESPGNFADFKAAFPTAWNAMAVRAGLARIGGNPPVLSKRRIEAAHLLAKDHPNFLKDWRLAVDALPRLHDYLGKNRSGWKLDVDGFLTARHFGKIYDRAESPDEGGVHIHEGEKGI